MPVKLEPRIQQKECIETPKMYCCVIHNDDVTTMDFVVMAIVKVFNKSTFEASKIMTNIHNNGKERIGCYCYDIAVTRKMAMDALARSHGFPLKTTVDTISASIH